MTDEKQITEYAEKVWKLAKDSIIVRFRFFDAALAKYSFVAEPGTGRYLADGSRLIYDPLRLLNDYKEEASFPVRLLLHVLFHSILGHTYRLYDGKIKEEYWNIACDIAVENIILDMDFALDKSTIEVLRECNSIVLVADGSAVSNNKLERALASLNILEQQTEMKLLMRSSILYNRFSSHTSAKPNLADIKELGGIKRYEGYSTAQLLTQLSEMTLFDALA